MDALGLHFGGLCQFVQHLFQVVILMFFEIRPGASGTWRGARALALRLSTIDPKSELTPLVFQHFQISGFLVPVRERLPKGNQPLSEVPPSEYLWRSTGEFQRSSERREEVRRNMFHGKDFTEDFGVKDR